MAQRVDTQLILPKRKGRPNRPKIRDTTARGAALLASPVLNKGTAFSAEERDTLGLTGLIPPYISTLAAQTKRAYLQYRRLPDPVSKNVYLRSLHDRNEVLFSRLLSEHLREMIPIVNDFTVGLAMMEYHHEFRRSGGIYLSINHIEEIDAAFANIDLASDAIDLVVATDAALVPGIGDWGVGGMELPIAKLAIFTAAGGIDPRRTIPVMLDAGTNRESLLQDSMYIGNRHGRVDGERYEAFIDAYVQAVTKRFPKAVLSWADFAPPTGRRILEKYQSRFATFNDDLQGVGAVTLAAAISATRICGSLFGNQRIVVFGAGMAGIGIADQLRDAMIREGSSKEEAIGRIWCVDIRGLLTDDMGSRLDARQAMYARPAAEVRSWKKSRDSGIDLAEVVRHVRPTMLIGASRVAGAFAESIVRDMAAHTERPIIFPLSNPESVAEATPAELIEWSDGRALIATGSPFRAVTHKGITYVIGHVDNVMLYPGLALGAIVARVRLITEDMIFAAANALSGLLAVRLPGASLLPQIDDLRRVSATVATAVVEEAVRSGVAGVRVGDIVSEVKNAMWQPEYDILRAS